jgi:hypothetical protein
MSVISNRSYSSDTQSKGSEKAICEMVEMVSGLSGILKDVVKELQKLKQPDQASRIAETTKDEINTQSYRNTQLSPDAEPFRPRPYETEQAMETMPSQASKT